MRRALLLFALCLVGPGGCVAFTSARAPDPEAQLHEGVMAIDAGDYTRASALLAPLFEERWNEAVGQRALLALTAADLDTRNPDRHLGRGAERAARLLNVPELPSWMIPVAESYYLLAVELGAHEQRVAEAEAAAAQAEARAQRAESGRMLPPAPQQTVPAQLRRLESARNTAQERATQLEQQLATRERELRETKAELERIKRTIKP